MHIMSSGGSSSKRDGTQVGRQSFLPGRNRLNIEVSWGILQLRDDERGEVGKVKLLNDDKKYLPAHNEI